MTKNSRNNYNLIQSFSFALQGIAFALRSERNLRIHLSAAGWLLYFVRYYALPKEQLALLLLVIGLVITCELFNTAIEKTVDIEEPAYNPLAKIAKDVAAGAVLVSSIASVCVGVLLLWKPDVIAQIWADVLRHFPLWVVISALNIRWIAGPGKSKRK